MHPMRAPLNIHRSDFIDTFEVLVGQPNQQKSFTIHKNIICRRSAFFKAARSTCWTDAKKPTKLPGDQPAVFAAYLTCVYTNKVPVLKEWEEDFALYVLADKLQDTVSANLIMDSITDQITQSFVPDVPTMGHAFDDTHENSSLRKLMVHVAVHQHSEQMFVVGEECNANFLMAICREYARITDPSNVYGADSSFAVDVREQVEMNRCYFHQHNEEFPARECEG